MGINFTDLATKAINLVSGGVVDKVLGMVDKAIPDKNMAAQLKAQIETLRDTQAHEEAMAQVQLLLGQIEVNKTEAASASIFVAGWRPFIGWTCGVGVAYAFVVQPIMIFIAYLFSYDLTKSPVLDVASLLTLLFAMLGVAGLRTTEKIKGVAADSMER